MTTEQKSKMVWLGRQNGSNFWSQLDHEYFENGSMHQARPAVLIDTPAFVALMERAKVVVGETFEGDIQEDPYILAADLIEYFSEPGTT